MGFLSDCNYGTPSMKCPRCGSREITVKDSRPLDTTIRRRRQCRTCHHRWTTIEAAIDDNASVTTQVFTAELVKIHDLSEQVADLKIQNSVLRAQRISITLLMTDHIWYLFWERAVDPHTRSASLGMMTNSGTNIQRRPRLGLNCYIKNGKSAPSMHG